MAVSFKFVILIAALFERVDASEADQNLILISLDGFRWDYIHKPVRLPNIRRVINSGVIARKGLKNIFITKTFPNHYTLVTGLYAESHGMVANTMFDPELNKTYHLFDRKESRNPSWFEQAGEPIWVTNQARSTDHRSGVVFWPGCAGPVNGILPTHYVERDKTVTFREEIDMLVSWFTNPYPINLGVLYEGEPDHTGHKYGPFSTELDDKLIELDADLGYLFDKLEDHSLMSSMNIIVTSDHGMTTIYSEEDHKIDLDNYIDPSSYNIYTSSPVADIRPKSVEFEEEIYRNLSNIPHLTVYRRDEIPPQYHYSKNGRIAPILAVADEHYWISHKNSKGIKGNHGYNNSLPSMHPFFIAMGPSFKQNESVEIFNNVDIYPLMCYILKLTPAQNNGTLDVVQYLLVEPPNRSLSATLSSYTMIIIFTCLTSGIVVVMAYLLYRRRRARHRRDSGTVSYTKVDTEPLMNETPEDELTAEP